MVEIPPRIPPEITIERPDLFGGLGFASGRGLLSIYPANVWVFVKGTTHGEWADPASPFRRTVIEPQGITVGARVDHWSGAMWFPRPHWRTGGANLAKVLALLPYYARNLLTHSHGFNVAMHAAAEIPIYRHITIAGPVRRDMADVYARAVANTAYLVHIRDTERDRAAWWGSWFGGWPIGGGELPRRSNVHLRAIPNMGHSRLLYEPEIFSWWEERNLLPWFTVGTPPAVA